MNDAGVSINIWQSAANMLYLAGTASAADRVLAAGGIATLLCIASNKFIVHGTGVT